MTFYPYSFLQSFAPVNLCKINEMSDRELFDFQKLFPELKRSSLLGNHG